MIINEQKLKNKYYNKFGWIISLDHVVYAILSLYRS